MKINWESIAGYSADMTAEQKLELLNNYEFDAGHKDDAPTPGKTISKDKFDKLSSDYAALKKQLASRMTEDEKAEQERLTALEDLKTELEQFKTENEQLKRAGVIAGHVKDLLAQGYDSKLAEEAAVYLADNNSAAFLGAMKKHAEAYEKNLRAKILDETPKPPAGDTPPEGPSDPGVKTAVDIGKAIAGSGKAANDVLSHYI